jgi:cobalt-zinc-cadmium efflux system outer membrane protein
VPVQGFCDFLRIFTSIGDIFQTMTIFTALCRPSFLLASAAALCSVQASAQTAPSAQLGVSQEVSVPLTLQDLVSTVLTHNPALLAARQARTTASAAVRTAGALPNPKLEYQDGSNTARLPSTMAGRVQGLGISQFIENSAVRQARLEGAQALETGAIHHIAVTRNELVAQIHLRAYEVLLRRAEAAAATEALTLLEQVRERVRLRVESGEAARYEIIKADAEIIGARQRLQNATLQAEQSMLSLNRLAAGRLPARWSLEANLNETPALPTLAQLQAQALADNPELKAIQADLRKAQAQLDAARASRWPGLELRYQQNQEPEVQHNTLGLSVQVPLFDRREGPMAEAASELERQRGRLTGRELELQQQVLQAWKSLEMARLKVEALSQGAVRESESALRVAQAAYRFGERGILDVLDAQRVLRSVRADLLVASYEQQAARIELEFLAGRYAAPQ